MAEVLKKYKSIAAERKLPTVAEPDFKEGIELLIQSAMISKIVKEWFHFESRLARSIALYFRI